LLGVTIACNKSTFEYYIAQDDTEEGGRLQNWLMDSMSISGMLTDSHDVAGRIVLEEVPSARQHLPVIIEAMRHNRRIEFDYRTYTRAGKSHAVVVEPYFVKIFKQLWYVIGLNVKDKRIKTYALDRMSDLHVRDEEFVLPPDFSPSGFFKDCFGITTNQNDPKRIVLRVEPKQAKYFRALPLHPSQEEVATEDDYSDFELTLRPTPDFYTPLLSRGPLIKVLSPQWLADEIKRQHLEAAKLYEE